MRRLHFSLPVLALLLLSCASDPFNDGDELPPPPEVTISDGILEGFGEAIATEFSEGEGDLVDKSFDPVLFFSRMMWPAKPDAAAQAEFVRDFESGTGGGGGWLGARLAKQFASNATISFVRVLRDPEEGVRLVFRVMNGSGMNYLEFLVAEGDNGEPALADMYAASSGENLSRTLRRMYVGSGNGMIARLMNKAGKDVVDRTLEASEKMKELTAQGKNEEALTYFEELPKNIRRQKSLQLVRIVIASQTGDEARYAEAIREMLDFYPNDPGMDLIQADYYMIRKEYDSVLAAYDRLDGRVGDPYLDYQRACVWLEKGDTAQAARLAEKVMAWDSTLVEPHYVMIAIAAREKDPTVMAATLERMQQSGTAAIDFEAIEASKEYEDFVLSKEYGELKRKYE